VFHFPKIVILRLDRRIHRATGEVDPVVALRLPQDDGNDTAGEE